MVTRSAAALLCVLLGASALPAQQNTLGKSIFENKGNCYTCHGKNAGGTPLAPNLQDDEWLNVDGSVEQIKQLVKSGVPRPKRYPGAMPAMGGAKLKDAEIDAVASYVAGLRQATQTGAASATPRSPTDHAAASRHHAASTETPPIRAPASGAVSSPGTAPSQDSLHCGRQPMASRMGPRARQRRGRGHCC